MASAEGGGLGGGGEYTHARGTAIPPGGIRWAVHVPAGGVAVYTATVPGSGALMGPVEKAIREDFIPNLFGEPGCYITNEER